MGVKEGGCLYLLSIEWLSWERNLGFCFTCISEMVYSNSNIYWVLILFRRFYGVLRACVGRRVFTSIFMGYVLQYFILQRGFRIIGRESLSYSQVGQSWGLSYFVYFWVLLFFCYLFAGSVFIFRWGKYFWIGKRAFSQVRVKDVFSFIYRFFGFLSFSFRLLFGISLFLFCF